MALIFMCQNVKNNMQIVTKKHKWLLDAFMALIFTSVVLLILFRIEHLDPFGNNSLAIMDARIQYLDFFAYLKDVLEGKANLSYSFGKTLGGTNIAVFSYYLSSPVNLLVRFWNKENLNTFFDIVVLIKLSLCAATCAIFLKYRFRELKTAFVMFLSVSYAMMQYNFAQSSNIMWLDGVYMLPIVLLGVYKLVQEQTGMLLSISVGLAILFNWYSAGIDCMFSIFWCGIELLYKYKLSKDNFLPVFKAIGNYIMHMLLGVGISASLFLPTVFALKEGKGNFDWDGLFSGFAGNVLTIIQNFTIGSTSSKGSVSLFCGSFVLIGFISYFLGVNRCRREKQINLIVVVFTILIFYFLPLCFIFSLFKPVGSYWYRYSYVGVFVLVFISAQFYCDWDKKDVIFSQNILRSGFGFAGVLMILDFANSVWKINLTYVTVLCYIVVAFLLVLLRKSKKGVYKFVLVLLGVFVVGELSYNAHHLIKIYRARNVDEYKSYVENQKELTSRLKSLDNGFYRINQTLTRNMKTNNLTANYNEALAFNYNSIASYTSAPENMQLDFLENLGYRINGAAMNIVNTSILPADSLLGVKYVFAHEKIGGLLSVENSVNKNGKSIYQNPFCLPNAFVYKQVSQMNNNQQKNNPFLYQNDLYSRLLGRNVEIYKEIDFEQENEPQQRIYRLTIPSGKVALYGNIVTSKEVQGEIFIDGEFRTAYSEWLAPSVFYIPQKSTKEIIEVSLQAKEDLSKIVESQFYYVDLEKFQEIVNELSEKQVDMIDISEGKVQVQTLGTDKDLLYLNIPYHEQWSIRRNGIEIEPILFGECLMSIPLQNGDNKIEMVYQVKGLKQGIIISLSSLCLLIIYTMIRRRKCFQ